MVHCLVRLCKISSIYEIARSYQRPCNNFKMWNWSLRSVGLMLRTHLPLYSLYWGILCLELCLCGCSHSGKPLMVIHHKEDCQFSQGTAACRLYQSPLETCKNAGIQVCSSPAVSPANVTGVFSTTCERKGSWIPISHPAGSVEARARLVSTAHKQRPSTGKENKRRRILAFVLDICLKWK